MFKLKTGDSLAEKFRFASNNAGLYIMARNLYTDKFE